MNTMTPTLCGQLSVSARKWLTLLLLTTTAILAGCGGGQSASIDAAPATQQKALLSLFQQTTTTDVEITVISNRPDAISGGDALVEISASSPEELRVDIDGTDVTSAFAIRPNGKFQALLTGLKVGANVVTAERKNHLGAAITINNFPIGGPVFSGPQVQPWICATEAAGLGPALDEQCNARTKVTWLYKSSLLPILQAYDPAKPPFDVAMTTTDQGVTVPFIIRVERGVINRGVYEIDVLANPEQALGPWAPPRGWNGKLYWTFGGDTQNNHVQPDPGSSSQIMNLLGRGFATAASGLTIEGKNSNNVVSAETVMMVKEHIAETLGPIRFTMSEGFSGGAIQQQTIISNYPGLLNGIQPSGSFPDLWVIYQEAEDCHLLQTYFQKGSPLLWGVVTQQTAVSGFALPTICALWDAPSGGYAQAFADPANAPGCALPADQVYNAQTNPRGVRCTLQDYMVSLFGKRASDGFASFPFDNVGVQYGLNALNSRLITPEQFVDLNEKIGGIDHDWNLKPVRSQADPGALQVMYRAGLVNPAREAAKAAIIDLRPNDNIEVHHNVHSYIMRERLRKANGNSDNQIIWTSDLPLTPYSTSAPSIDMLDLWLTRIEADVAVGPLEDKVRRNKPAGAVDACWIAGIKITDMALCSTVFPTFADARIAAGAPLSNDIVKCQLKPLSTNEYTVQFTADQISRLQRAFPQGVCDFTKQSVGYQTASPWMTFAQGPGGTPLGDVPKSVPLKN